MIKALILAVLLMGCSSTTVITDRQGQIFTVESQKDAVVTFKDESVVVTVDNRGAPSIFDELTKLYFLRFMQTEQDNGE